MKNIFMVFIYLVCLTTKLPRQGGLKALIAENLLLKQQLFLITRSRKRAPNLSLLDRFLLDLWTIFLDPRRIKRAAILVQPSTLLQYHRALIKLKYRLPYYQLKPNLAPSTPEAGTLIPDQSMDYRQVNCLLSVQISLS